MIACRSAEARETDSPPFSHGSWSPHVRFSSTHRRFFWTGRRDFISFFCGSGKCHLSALLSWWKSLRGGYSGSRSITSRLAAGARDLQTVKVRRQISVAWPGGGASVTVSPLLWWSPWRSSSFMEQKKKKNVYVPCFCAIDVDLLDYRWCKGTGLYDDASDWRDAHGLSLSWGFIIIKESNSPHQAMQSNIFTGGESLSSSGSGWCCFAYCGSFAGMPGWPAERFEHRRVNWWRGIFRATKQTAWAIGRSMAARVPRRRHLWLNLTGIKDKDPTFLLDAPISPSGLFGDAVNTVATRFGRQSATRRPCEVSSPPCSRVGNVGHPVPTKTGSSEAWSTRRVWRAEHPLVETGVRLAALHSPPQRDWTWGASSPPREGPEACAPRTPGVCPPGERCVKFQQRIKTPSWHPQEAVVQSPPPLLFRGAAVSSDMLRVRLLPVTFQDTAHLTSPIKAKCQN